MSGIKKENTMKRTKLMLGDNITSLRKLPDNSIDSIVTDPPYGLSFMGKKWDYDVPSVEFWKEVYRVLKPGGHILSFGGTRTYHRMAVNIEDAGFEIRDQIMWLYGSGFPKSHNIGKAVDKLEGNEREVVGEMKGAGSIGTTYISGQDYTDGLDKGVFKSSYTGTKGQSEWEGWGTALKPANEPICLARKPLSEKSVAENVLKWRTGGINVDGCRIGSDTIKTNMMNTKGGLYNLGNENRTENKPDDTTHEGRFPANIILDEIAGEILDEQSGNIKSTGSVRKKENEYDGTSYKGKNELGRSSNPYAGENGGASRFFYQAKVSKKERNMGLDNFEEKQKIYFSKKSRMKEQGTEEDEPSDGMERFTSIQKNNHPTVKPVSLMAYLCRLITPPNGIILDPFMGSGSTGIAAQLEGFRFVGMEMDEDYFKIAETRIENYESYREFIK
jgi:site-specific DNA-methyltransferase (adenine-specific)